jgi:hypothetical protein
MQGIKIRHNIGGVITFIVHVGDPSLNTDIWKLVI